MRLNNKQILGSVEFNHCTVLEIFQTLPIETTIYMVILKHISLILCYRVIERSFQQRNCIDWYKTCLFKSDQNICTI